jgi:hypothetical protein
MKTEDSYNTDNLYCSLPIRRAEIVISRFLLTITVVMAAIIMGLIVLGISSIFSISGFYPEKILITRDILTLLVPIILLFSVYFPLYFRYGYRPGLQVGCYTASLLAFIVWLGLLYIIVSISSGSWQISFSEGKSFSFMLTIALIIKKGFQVFSTRYFYLFIGMCMVSLILMSIKLSLIFYSKREF